MGITCRWSSDNHNRLRQRATSTHRPASQEASNIGRNPSSCSDDTSQASTFYRQQNHRSKTTRHAIRGH